MHWMRCTLNIAVNVVAHETPIAYKYVVYSPNRGGDSPYEVLQGDASHYNRYLKVPRASCHHGGKYCI